MLSGQPVFLTGAPGAGKTYVLNQFIKRSKRAGKNVAVTASTGIAATHIGGTTIHSWSGLGIRDKLMLGDAQRLKANERLVKRYNSTDILVIDEVSMLHGSRLDMVNQVCKLLRGSDKPFGGLQVVLVGDLFQLPPVGRDSANVDFAHNSQAWQELNPQICYITEQHRQQAGDLLQLLEAMRVGAIEEWHESLLQDRLGRRPPTGTAVTRLYSHNVDVEAINQRYLDDIKDDTQIFYMQTKGAKVRAEALTKSILAPEELQLKIGAEVMFVANNYKQKFANGSRGQVVDFKDGAPVVKLYADGRVIKVEPHNWSINEDGKVKAEAIQLPLRLAWAITIHKSQGMSLDAAELDLGKSFTPGMGYVALSRVRSLDGIYLASINQMALQLHPEIYELDKSLRAASAQLAAQTAEAPKELKSLAPTINDVLLAKLKNWRTQRAKSDGVPPYIVAHDSLLSALAAKRPLSHQQLLATDGIGQHKLDAYGDELLAILLAK